MDRGAWRATVQRVAKSQTWPSTSTLGHKLSSFCSTILSLWPPFSRSPHVPRWLLKASHDVHVTDTSLEERGKKDISPGFQRPPFSPKDISTYMSLVRISYMSLMRLSQTLLATRILGKCGLSGRCIVSPSKIIVCYQEGKEGTSKMFQWIRICTPNAGGPGSIPGQGTRTCMLQLTVHMPQPRPNTAKYTNNKKGRQGKVCWGRHFCCSSQIIIIRQLNEWTKRARFMIHDLR